MVAWWPGPGGSGGRTCRYLRSRPRLAVILGPFFDCGPGARLPGSRVLVLSGVPTPGCSALSSAANGRDCKGPTPVVEPGSGSKIAGHRGSSSVLVARAAGEVGSGSKIVDARALPGLRARHSPLASMRHRECRGRSLPSAGASGRAHAASGGHNVPPEGVGSWAPLLWPDGWSAAVGCSAARAEQPGVKGWTAHPEAPHTDPAERRHHPRPGAGVGVAPERVAGSPGRATLDAPTNTTHLHRSTCTDPPAPIHLSGATGPPPTTASAALKTRSPSTI